MACICLPQFARPYALVEAEGEQSLEELPGATIEQLYRAHGAILLRGFAADVHTFGAFARRFCRTAAVNESPGREPLDAGQNVYSVDGGRDAFALHPELSREPWKPDAAFFCCLAAPRSGGATTICDGIELAAMLPRPVFDTLKNRRLVYVMPTWPALLDYWLGTETPDAELLAAPPVGCPYGFLLLPDGRILRHFSRPALHKPMFADGLAFGNFLLFARFVRGRRDFPLLDDMTPVPEVALQAIKAAGDALTVEIKWRDGDLLRLDNTRFMHGRTAIEPTGERRIATFFGYLDFAQPDPEEPRDPIWRREDFVPPAHPAPRS